ncbi:hypothetical protein L610_000700000350 [Aminobacter sp. J44]|jgi:hypothetical protein|nr:hypothetical protein L610_000700000350 [Aminobacter sp. J44]
MNTKGVTSIMKIVKSSRRLAALAGALALLTVAQPAFAQEISDSHLAAARTAIGALGATAEFDVILPQAAQALKTELIQKNPDMQADIIEIVDKTALSLAARRGDLEREAGLAYARVFTEQQLNEIATFYQSETGKKLISDGAIVMREVYRAAEIWQNGIARDLAQQVATELQQRFEAAKPAEGGEQPAQQ